MNNQQAAREYFKLQQQVTDRLTHIISVGYPFSQTLSFDNAYGGGVGVTFYKDTLYYYNEYDDPETFHIVIPYNILDSNDEKINQWWGEYLREEQIKVYQQTLHQLNRQAECLGFKLVEISDEN